jgi:hypothetical protein
MKPLSERPDWTIDQGWNSYTAAEHATWKTLFERQTELLPGRACDEFVQGMRDLPMGANEIADFECLIEVLDLAKIDFAPLYQQIEDKPDMTPGQLQAQDVLFNRGTGSYHAKA